MFGYPDSYYASLDRHPASFPECLGSIEIETCVIGGGLAGLATALNLAEAGRTVMLIEAQKIGWGASGRNGGFASRGYPLSMPMIAQRHGRDVARTLWRLSSEALDLVRRRAESAGETALQGRGALRCQVAGHPGDLPAYVSHMNGEFDAGLVHIPARELRGMLDTDFYEDAYLNPSSLQIDPLALALSMAEKAAAKGARLHEASPALKLQRSGAGWQIATPSATINARNAVLAGGAHLGFLSPRLGFATVPVASFVMVTETAPERLSRAIRTGYAVSDTRVATDYYRLLPDGRLMWGGRASAFDWSAPKARRRLQADLARIYPALANLNIEYCWSGLMPIARHRMPIIGPLEQGLWAAACFAGLGLVTTTMAGELIGSAIAHGDDRYRHFAPFGPSFAGGSLGKGAFQAIYWRHQLEDGWRRAHVQKRKAA